MYSSQNILQNIKFSDTTEREGRQAKGLHLNPSASIEYAKLINKIGIEYIEMNHPASSPTLASLIRNLKELDLNTKISTHVRCLQRDVQIAIQSGAQCINTYIPVNPSSKNTIIHSINTSLYELDKIIELTKKNNIELRISIEHTFSIPEDSLVQSYNTISHLDGVTRVGMAETTGVCLPSKFKEYAQIVYEIIPSGMEIQFHMHNDHGLVAANFFEIVNLISQHSYKAIFDISIGGFGERNGILSYGDIFSLLYILDLNALKNKYRIENYAELISFVEKNLNVKLSRRDPLNPWAFSHSAGPHLDGMINGHNPYQKIQAEDFGFDMKLNIGHCVTGYKGIQHWTKKFMNLNLDDTTAKNIASILREYTLLNGPLDDLELDKFISKYIKPQQIDESKIHLNMNF